MQKKRRNNEDRVSKLLNGSDFLCVFPHELLMSFGSTITKAKKTVAHKSLHVHVAGDLTIASLSGMFFCLHVLVCSYCLSLFSLG